MAIDPKTISPQADEDFHPANENELPAYRAVSRLAIASLVFGIASVFSFVAGYFALFGMIAIVFGLMAQRRIRSLPDVLTGSRMADAGIALGLLFSLSALTITTSQTWIIDHEARKFARSYVEALRSGSLDNVLFLEMHPESRKTKTQAELIAEMKQSMRGPGMLEMQTQAPRDMMKRLASTPGQTVELGKITDHTVVGMDAYVEFLLVFKGPRSQEFPADVQYGIVRFQGIPEGRTFGWKALFTKFPQPVPPGGF